MHVHPFWFRPYGKEIREARTNAIAEPSLGLLFYQLSVSRLITIAQIEGPGLIGH